MRAGGLSVAGDDVHADQLLVERDADDPGPVRAAAVFCGALGPGGDRGDGGAGAGAEKDYDSHDDAAQAKPGVRRLARQAGGEARWAPSSMGRRGYQMFKREPAYTRPTDQLPTTDVAWRVAMCFSVFCLRDGFIWLYPCRCGPVRGYRPACLLEYPSRCTCSRCSSPMFFDFFCFELAHRAIL